MSADASAVRTTGQVKWFNTKAGYGFITICNCEDEAMVGKDIFVHFSSIKVISSQYRYLVQGEYVEFSIVKMENSKHEYHADDITGIKRGLLMCETRSANGGRDGSGSGPRYQGGRGKYNSGAADGGDGDENPEAGEDGGAGDDVGAAPNTDGFKKVISKRHRKATSNPRPRAPRRPVAAN